MDLFTLDAAIRTDIGKGASRRLRHANQVPAIVYGAGQEPVSITLAHNKLWRAQQEEAFYSHVLTLNIGSDKVEVVIKDMQRHPYKEQVMHLDFLRVDAKKELNTAVPIHFLNEEEAAKTGASILHTATEIVVACLPADLPEFIEVDVKDLTVGNSIHLSEIALPKGVTSVELAKGEGHDIAIVSAQAPKGAAAETEGEGEEEATEE